MKKNILKCLLPGVFILSLMISCKKNNLVVDNDVTPPPFAKFLTNTPLKFDVTSTHTKLNIPVSVTNVSDADRTVKISVTSPSGALSGIHYTTSTSVVIPAGKAIDSLLVTALYSGYVSGRKDTLIFTIVDGDVKASAYNNKYTLYLYGPCSESQTVLSSLQGDYKNTIENYGGGTPYGPYTTTISSVTQLTPTTGTVVVTNIFDYGWNPITFTLDWTNPLNTKVTLAQQSGIGDAGTLDPSLAGMDITVRPFAGQTGTFSYCSNTLTLKMQLGVTGLGFLPDLYTVNMAR